MRTVATIQTTSKMTASAAITTSKATFSPPAATIQRSPWHSPVPYLFGGLAAMLGLIAFALLILACSYWKLSGQLNNGESDERDVEAGEDNKPENIVKDFPVFEEKIVVIMAGDVTPTFLATPMSSRASSFGDGNGKSDEKQVVEKCEIDEKAKEEVGCPEATTASTTVIENSATNEAQANQEQNL